VRTIGAAMAAGDAAALEAALLLGQACRLRLVEVKVSLTGFRVLPACWALGWSCPAPPGFARPGSRCGGPRAPLPDDDDLWALAPPRQSFWSGRHGPTRESVWTKAALLQERLPRSAPRGRRKSRGLTRWTCGSSALRDGFLSCVRGASLDRAGPPGSRAPQRVVPAPASPDTASDYRGARVRPK